MRAKRLAIFILLTLSCFQVANAEWEKQNTNTFAWFRDVFFINESKGLIVGGDGVMLSTENGGRTWTQTPKFTPDAFVQIYFTDETTGWMLCERDVYARGVNASRRTSGAFRSSAIGFSG